MTNNNQRPTAAKKPTFLITALLYVAIWGIAYTLWMTAGNTSVIVIAICAFFGWRALSRIQPAMFLWMSWTGWFVYIFVKFFLSAVIGLFVTPWVISKWISKKVN